MRGAPMTTTPMTSRLVPDEIEKMVGLVNQSDSIEL